MYIAYMIHSHFIFATVLFSSSILINDLQEKMLIQLFTRLVFLRRPICGLPDVFYVRHFMRFLFLFSILNI